MVLVVSSQSLSLLILIFVDKQSSCIFDCPEELAREYASQPECCLAPGPCRGVVRIARERAHAGRTQPHEVDRILDPVRLIGETVAMLLRLKFHLFSLSWFYQLSTAKIERVHTEHHGLCHSKQGAPAVFSALGLLSKLRSRLHEWAVSGPAEP